MQQLVTVTARVHLPAELRALGPDAVQASVVDTSMAWLPQPGPRAMWASEAEADAVAEALLQIVQSVLQDTDMHEAVAGLAGEAVPLFNQLDASAPGKGTLPAGALLVGDAPTVAAKMLAVSAALGGIARLNLQMSVAALSHPRTLHAIELLGTQAAPLVRAAAP